jgi:hypothetical protein
VGCNAIPLSSFDPKQPDLAKASYGGDPNNTMASVAHAEKNAQYADPAVVAQELLHLGANYD